MGSAGHAFIAHTKALSPRAQHKDGGYGAPPHPLVARAGQRYWARTATRRTVLLVQRVERERVVLQRLGEKGPSTRITIRRLLEVREDGQGRHYQFQGFTPRRYKTHACVCRIEDSDAILCLPEWHPRRPVRLPLRLLPPPAQAENAWLELRCDLGASSAARLQPSDLAEAPGECPPDWLPSPDLAEQRSER
jgi:hypothetical protein